MVMAPVVICIYRMIMLFSVYRYETPLKLLMDGYLKTGEVIIGDEEPRLKVIAETSAPGSGWEDTEKGKLGRKSINRMVASFHGQSSKGSKSQF